LEGNKAGSKSKYEDFFTLWKDADPDVPVLQQARRNTPSSNNGRSGFQKPIMNKSGHPRAPRPNVIWA
jgi:hypothetical protein